MSLRVLLFALPVVLVSSLQLSACGSGGGGGGGGGGGDSDLSAFPPMANDHPPGASVQAQTIAAALGRGVNFGNMLEAPNEGDWGLTVQTEYFTKAKDAGFVTIRLPVRWSNHAAATSPYAIDADFMTRVEAVVDEALAAGFYVMMDMHHYRQLDGDNLDAGEFSVSSGVVDLRFLTLWQQIATRFKDKSDHLLFEIYNEPHNRLTNAKWNDLAARALNVIRLTNPNRVVVIGPTIWNSASGLSGLRVPNDANLIVTIHNYEPFTFTHQGATWVTPTLPTGVTCCDTGQQATITNLLDIAQNWSTANHYPIFLGEFGAYSAAPLASRVNFTRFMRDQAEARAMSWTYWEMASGFGVYDPVAHDWYGDGTLLNALLGSSAGIKF
jgi:endoglucanase